LIARFGSLYIAKSRFTFGVNSELIWLIVDQPSLSIDLPLSLVKCLRFSRDMAAYSFTRSIALIRLKPKLTTFGRWLSVTTATSQRPPPPHRRLRRSAIGT
jgi:hypothetical protein